MAYFNTDEDIVNRLTVDGHSTENLKFIREGAHKTVVVDDTSALAYWFPVDSQGKHFTSNEVEVLQRLGGKTTVPTSRVLDIQEDYTVVSYLPGKPINECWQEMNEGQHAEAVRDLVIFLRELHNTEWNSDGFWDENLHYNHDAYIRNYQRYREHPERIVDPKSRQKLTGELIPFLDDPRNFDYTPVPIHADIRGRHILVDERGRVSGIIDFGCSALGDPAYDLARLAKDLNELFFRIANEEYPDYPSIDSRVRFLVSTMRLRIVD